MQGEALLDIRKRPSPIEKGVSLISKYNYLYPPLPPSPILLAVFTPLSIRRGGGGEAVDGLVVSLSLGLCCTCFYSHLITIKGEGRALFDSYDR